MTENNKARLERCKWLIDRQPHDQLFSAYDLANFNRWTGNNYIAAKRTRNPTFPGAKRYVMAQRQDGTWGDTTWLQDIGSNLKRA